MRANDYRIVTSWRVDATADEIGQIVTQLGDLSRWWPASFLCVQPTAPAQSLRVGSEASFYTKGWLPYTLRFDATVQKLEYPHECIVDVRGDFEGRLCCEICEAGSQCQVRFDWQVRVHKPIVRQFSFLLKPVFFYNHVWVMLQGYQSLKIELARRRSRQCGAIYRGAAPPQPTFPCGPRYRWLRATIRAFSDTSPAD